MSAVCYVHNILIYMNITPAETKKDVDVPTDNLLHRTIRFSGEYKGRGEGLFALPL